MIYLPLLICIIGALAYGLSANSKVQALALHAFWVGLFITLMNGGKLFLR